ncbi:MAG: multicopper oxidase domain-containing protein [Methylococcales bacterium]|nr:multicopper oxidase domain-containing protein [Methylococcales bacterium]
MEGVCGSNMRMDMKGMVMYENKETIPKDCTEVSEDITIKVSAGIKYAEQYPGTVFGFDEHQWEVKPCSRVTVEFTNDDDIRHQWMIHGLPKYIYPEGMFHIEVNGQEKKTGTFIVPNSDYTYLVHCDIAQHMEKGMKAQLVVGKGRGDLPSIPGISNPTFPDDFSQKGKK